MIIGIDAAHVDVEVDVGTGLSALNIVGLPGAGVKESRERIRPAVKNSGYFFPNDRITVNLAPADERKEGPVYDLPIALGLLAATEQLKTDLLDDYLFVGELSLDGSCRKIKGVLPAAILARNERKKGIVVPAGNAAEAKAVTGIEVVPVGNLTDAVGFLTAGISLQELETRTPDADCRTEDEAGVDFADVKGQEYAKRAMTVAAAGGHNIMMVGPPGTGKTMMARRIPTILPELTFDEALEVTKIFSVAGSLPKGVSLLRVRPFRAPHHTMTLQGMIGGGSNPIRPGEITMAHRGVLFLDEALEFDRMKLEALRQPLEDRFVTISRVAGQVQFPADFMLVLSANLCPCGKRGDPKKRCICTPQQIERYFGRLSGATLDRIDIFVEAGPVDYRDLNTPEGQSSAQMRVSVGAAREIQSRRFAAKKRTCLNTNMNARERKKFCALDAAGERLLRMAMDEMGLSARGHTRVLRVARTIADLENTEKISTEHLAEALQYRRREG